MLGRLLMLFVSLMCCLLVASAAAFTPNPTLTNLADNTVMDLGAFTCTQPAGDSAGCERVTDFSGSAYDSVHNTHLMFGGGHATTFTDTLFVFSADTLTWTEQYPPTPCTSGMSSGNYDHTRAAWISGSSGPYPRPISRHTYDENVVAENTGEFIVMMYPNGAGNTCPGYEVYSDARIAHFNFTTNSWSFSPNVIGDGFGGVIGVNGTAEYDPVSGNVVLLGRYGLWLYNPVTKTEIIALDNYNQSTFDNTNMAYAAHLVYFPPNQRFYYFAKDGGPVYELILNRTNPSSSTVTQLTTSGTQPNGEFGYDYDTVNKVIGGGVSNNTFYTFDPTTRTWSSQVMRGGTPGDMAYHALSYDRVNNVFIFIDAGTAGRHTWAYRYRRGSGGGTPPAAPTGLRVQ
jgi:hypothetical protein